LGAHEFENGSEKEEISYQMTWLTRSREKGTKVHQPDFDKPPKWKYRKKIVL